MELPRGLLGCLRSDEPEHHWQFEIGSDLTVTIPSNGKYSLIVYNNTSFSTGTYSFEAIQNVNPTTTLTLSQTWVTEYDRQSRRRGHLYLHRHARPVGSTSRRFSL